MAIAKTETGPIIPSKMQKPIQMFNSGHQSKNKADEELKQTKEDEVGKDQSSAGNQEGRQGKKTLDKIVTQTLAQKTLSGGKVQDLRTVSKNSSANPKQPAKIMEKVRNSTKEKRALVEKKSIMDPIQADHDWTDTDEKNANKTVRGKVDAVPSVRIKKARKESHDEAEKVANTINEQCLIRQEKVVKKVTIGSSRDSDKEPGRKERPGVKNLNEKATKKEKNVLTCQQSNPPKDGDMSTVVDQEVSRQLTMEGKREKGPSDGKTTRAKYLLDDSDSDVDVETGPKSRAFKKKETVWKDLDTDLDCNAVQTRTGTKKKSVQKDKSAKVEAGTKDIKTMYHINKNFIDDSDSDKEQRYKAKGNVTMKEDNDMDHGLEKGKYAPNERLKNLSTKKLKGVVQEMHADKAFSTDGAAPFYFPQNLRGNLLEVNIKSDMDIDQLFLPFTVLKDGQLYYRIYNQPPFTDNYSHL